MKKKRSSTKIAWIALFALGLSWGAMPGSALAHCDTLDGPVVTDAAAALSRGDVTPVLKWVKKGDEAQVEAAFQKTLAVRNRGQEVKEVADHYFFETLIRLHRAGEGAPFEGLKAAGTIEPPVAAADAALEQGSVDPLARKIAHSVEEAIHARFTRVNKAKAHKDESVEAGREYVAAYVAYVHFVEGLHHETAPAGARGTHASAVSNEKHGH